MDQKQYSAIMGELATIKALLGNRSAPAAQPSAPIVVDLDGQYGDPVVKWPTNKWTGENMEGRKFSECPAEFLLLEAEWLEQKGHNPRAGKEQFARRDLENAAKARGWAKRNAGKTHAPVSGHAPIAGDDSDIPF